MTSFESISRSFFESWVDLNQILAFFLVVSWFESKYSGSFLSHESIWIEFQISTLIRELIWINSYKTIVSHELSRIETFLDRVESNKKIGSYPCLRSINSAGRGSFHWHEKCVRFYMTQFQFPLTGRNEPPVLHVTSRNYDMNAFWSSYAPVPPPLSAPVPLPFLTCTYPLTQRLSIPPPSPHSTEGAGRLLIVCPASVNDVR